MKFHHRWAAAALSVAALSLVATTPAWAVAYTITDLGTLGGIDNASYAYGINASGQVVGASYAPASSGTRAFLYSGGVMTNLGDLGGNGSVAYGINNNGQVVGWSLRPLSAVSF